MIHKLTFSGTPSDRIAAGHNWQSHIHSERAVDQPFQAAPDLLARLERLDVSDL